LQVLNELENKYEHKLADQLEKYDRMSEKMQLLKQKCEGLLEAEKNNFTKQLNDVKDEVDLHAHRIIDNILYAIMRLSIFLFRYFVGS